jgi:hypothetical protein
VLASQPPKAVGVLCGKDRTGELWSLKALHQYVIDHGWKQGYVVGADRLRTWLAAPELQGKLPYWGPDTCCTDVAKKAKEPQPQRLAAGVRGLITKANGTHGNVGRGDDETPAAAPVTLPTVFFASRPEIPPSDRERLGKDYKPPAAPVSVTEARRSDDEVIAEGEAALRRIRGARPMPDWIKVGRALLVLRKRAMQEVNAKKPRGITYVTRNHALLRQHGFLAITKSTRQCAMLVVENLPAIEAWLKTLDDPTGLNHPVVIWRGYLKAKKHRTRVSEGAWRGRQFMPEADFAKILQAIVETLPSGDAVTIAKSVVRAMGYAVPRKAYCGREIVTPPPTVWSPFAFSL